MHNKLRTANVYGPFSTSQIEAGTIAALALVVYVKYRSSSEEVRKHFFDVINNIDSLLYNINEVRPFDIDKVKLSAFQVFKARYADTTHPVASTILTSANPLHTALVATTTDLPPENLVTLLLRDMRDVLATVYGKGDV